MRNTQPRAPTTSNSKVPSASSNSCQFGRRRRNPNVNFLPGLCYTRRFLPLTTCQNDIGHTTQFASSVDANRRLQHTYARIASSQNKFGLSWSNGSVFSVLVSVTQNGSPHKHWRRCRSKIEVSQRKVFDGIMIYFLWNIWKEINRRTFQNTALQPRQVALLCKEDRTKPVGKWIRWPSRLVLVEFCGEFRFCTCGPGRLSGPCFVSLE